MCEALERERESLNLSLASSERIRKQQKELIKLLQENGGRVVVEQQPEGSSMGLNSSSATLLSVNNDSFSFVDASNVASPISSSFGTTMTTTAITEGAKKDSKATTRKKSMSKAGIASRATKRTSIMAAYGGGDNYHQQQTPRKKSVSPPVGDDHPQPTQRKKSHSPTGSFARRGPKITGNIVVAAASNSTRGKIASTAAVDAAFHKMDSATKSRRRTVAASSGSLRKSSIVPPKSKSSPKRLSLKIPSVVKQSERSTLKKKARGGSRRATVAHF